MLLQGLTTVIVILCWFVYLPMFIGKDEPDTKPIRQGSGSKWGIILQYAGSAVVWFWRRPLFSPLEGTRAPLRIVAPIVAVLLAVGSVYFSRLALQALGKQWSFVAGVTAKHRLIKDGPYSLIRHPLYVCFFGLTMATGLVWSMPAGLLLSAPLFWIGVWIRVRSEEKILHETFGAEFEAYVQRVPAFFPFR